MGIISTTRLEWILLDLAVACAAGATTTVYPNTAAGDVEFILEDSGTCVVVVEDAAQLAKVEASPVLKEAIHTVIVIDAANVELSDRVISYTQLQLLGAELLKQNPEAVDKAIASTDHDTLSTLIYTSGTTGQPKGVRLNHASWIYEGSGTKYWKIIDESDLQYLWLPLSHVFGKALIACQIAYGFASAVDGRIDRIVDGLGEVKPTFMCGAPRIFEKVRAAVMTANTGLKDRISRWAFAVGRDSRGYRLSGRPMPGSLALKYRLADALVFSKLKAKLGGRMKFMISGSAKLSAQVAGVVPAVAEHLRRDVGQVVISGGDDGSAQQHLPVLGEFRLDPGHHLAHRSETRLGGNVQEGDGRGLRGAVSLDYQQARGIEPFLHLGGVEKTG